MTLRSSLNRKILALAIPAIIANITTPLLSLVDIAIVGHLGSSAFVGAIAVGGSMFSMIYWLFGFLRFGTSGLTAQAVGRCDSADTELILLRSLAIGWSIGLLLILLQRPLEQAVLAFLQPDEATRAAARLYFRVLIYGAPAVLTTYSLNGWFVGVQNTRMAMWISILINVCNIAGSLLLVYACRLQLTGVALGTLIAQYAGALTGLAVCRVRYGVSFRPFAEVMQWEKLRRFLRINADIFLRTICLIAVTVWFTREGARQGTLMLDANTLLMQFFIIFTYLMDGFAFAGEALCGKYVGARRPRAVRICIMRLMQWGAGIALLFTALYAVGETAFLRLLTNDAEILAVAMDYRLWALVIPLAGFAAFVWDGILVGETRTRLMLVSMIAATAVFFIVFYSLMPTLGNHALWLAFCAYLFVRGAVQTALH